MKTYAAFLDMVCNTLNVVFWLLLIILGIAMLGLAGVPQAQAITNLVRLTIIALVALLS